MFIGSEGALGIITEAWMRLQDRPSFRASASVTFDDYARATECVRRISQAGLYPTNFRLLDAEEALTSGAGDGRAHVLILGFESADHRSTRGMARALECCRDHGGNVPEDAGRTRSDESASREGAAGAWRNAFLRAPYLRDALVAMGMISRDVRDRDHLGSLRRVPRARDDGDARRAAARVRRRQRHVPLHARVSRRAGAVLHDHRAVGKPASAARAVGRDQGGGVRGDPRRGGTITHHHAVGRDHRPWYDRQRPDAFAAALRAAKRALDPAGVLNPGVLVDP